MTNRRRHKRVPLISFVVLKVMDGEGMPTIKTLTADISMSGIGLYSRAPLELDHDVSIAVNFISNGSLMTEHVEGRVIYVNGIGEFYFVGIEFRQEIASGRQPSLHQRLQRILSYYEDTQ
ncbi:MAG: PilZ domain-containing protein [Candidatus Sulfobium sp.]